MSILEIISYPHSGELVTINGNGGPISALPIEQDHGEIPSLGFRFGKLANFQVRIADIHMRGTLGVLVCRFVRDNFLRFFNGALRLGAMSLYRRFR